MKRTALTSKISRYIIFASSSSDLSSLSSFPSPFSSLYEKIINYQFLMLVFRVTSFRPLDIQFLTWIMGWTKWTPISFLLLSFRSLYIYPRSTHTDWLTDLLTHWLTDLLIHSVRIKILTKVEESCSFRVSGSKSPGQRSLEATFWELLRRIFG